MDGSLRLLSLATLEFFHHVSPPAGRPFNNLVYCNSKCLQSCSITELGYYCVFLCFPAIICLVSNYTKYFLTALLLPHHNVFHYALDQDGSSL